MSKHKLRCLGLFLLPLLTVACGGKDKATTPTATTATATAGPHGPAEINLMSGPIFSGQALNAATWRDLQAYVLAGPTNLIVADLLLVPDQMSQAGFDARWTVQLYALSRTYAGMNWLPGDGESQALYDVRDQIDAWWTRYIAAVIQVMQKAPQTTALIIQNDGHDRLGRTLGRATLSQMAPVADRVTLGNTVPD